MRRSLALLVLCATSWSYVAGLHCEMGATGAPGDRSAPPVQGPHGGPDPHGAGEHGAHHGHATAHAAPLDGTEPTPPQHRHRDADGDRCQITMTCGVLTSAPAPTPTVHEATASAKRVVPASSSIPGVASPAMDPPPPRPSA